MRSQGMASKRRTVVKQNGMWGGIYGMGLIGSAFYFIGKAASFGDGVLGAVKALFWPAVLMYRLLEYLQM